MELKPGAQVDRYTLVQRLGAGGQGEVWRAEDKLQPGRAAALKLVPLAVAEASQIERVRREARHLARLNHPGLPGCHGLFEDLQNNLLVVAMELVEGPTLTEAARSLDERQRGAVLRHLASVLAFLHGAGVIHRDVKPENVILASDFWADPLRQGCVKLIDLGISVASGNPQPLTVVGHVIGTPSFLAPEILDPHYFPALQDTPASDVFAFGVLGWLLLYDAHPTGLPEGSSMTSYALAYREADQVASWPPPGRGDRWEPLLRRCLAVRARERMPSAAEVLAALSGGDAGLTPSLGSTRVEPVVDRPSIPAILDRPSSLPSSSALPPTRLEPAPANLPPPVPSQVAPTPPMASLPVLAAFPPTTPQTAPHAHAPQAIAHERPAFSPAPSTVVAAPLPSSFLDEPSRPSALPPAAPPAPARPAPAPILPAPPVGFLPAPPAAPAPAALTPQPSRPLSRGRAPAPIVKEKPSIVRYILAGLLLLFGGAAAFVLSIILFVLFQIGR